MKKKIYEIPDRPLPVYPAQRDIKEKKSIFSQFPFMHVIIIASLMAIITLINFIEPEPSNIPLAPSVEADSCIEYCQNAGTGTCLTECLNGQSGDSQSDPLLWYALFIPVLYLLFQFIDRGSRG